MYDIFDMQCSDYAGVTDPTGFDPKKLTYHKVNQHFAVLDQEQTIRGRCSIWWEDTAVVDRRRIGAIGHYHADSAPVAETLLDYACREIRAHGCGLAVGPLDGNTWRRYRFVTDRGSAKPFFLEPDNPAEWPAQFVENGFATFAHYVSELNTDIVSRQPETGDLAARFSRMGVTIEPLDLNGPAGVLEGIYSVIGKAFVNSALYTKLDFDEFARTYAPLMSTVDSRLMLIARHGRRVVGFIFAPPDFLQSVDTANIDTIVIKTIAVLPDPLYRGLGRVLIVEMLRNAIELGYRQAISALMATSTRSQAISSACAGPMRGYSIFARAMNP